MSLARELIGCGVRPTIVDAAQRPAARWHKRHPQLHLNTHRSWSYLRGKKMPRIFGAYPSRDDFIRYLEEYEREHQQTSSSVSAEEV